MKIRKLPLRLPEIMLFTIGKELRSSHRKESCKTCQERTNINTINLIRD